MPLAHVREPTNITTRSNYLLRLYAVAWYCKSLSLRGWVSVSVNEFLQRFLLSLGLTLRVTKHLVFRLPAAKMVPCSGHPHVGGPDSLRVLVQSQISP